MLSKALSYCVAEENAFTLADVFDNIDVPADPIQKQQETFLNYVRNPHLNLEDH